MAHIIPPSSASSFTLQNNINATFEQALADKQWADVIRIVTENGFDLFTTSREWISENIQSNELVEGVFREKGTEADTVFCHLLTLNRIARDLDEWSLGKIMDSSDEDCEIVSAPLSASNAKPNADSISLIARKIALLLNPLGEFISLEILLKTKDEWTQTELANTLPLAFETILKRDLIPQIDLTKMIPHVVVYAPSYRPSDARSEDQFIAAHSGVIDRLNDLIEKKQKEKKDFEELRAQQMSSPACLIG